MYKKEKTRFEKRFDVFCWTIIVLAVGYFVGRVMCSVLWGI